MATMTGTEGNYYVSECYGSSGGDKWWNDGTYSDVRSITMTANDEILTSLQVTYGLEGSHPSVVEKPFEGITHGGVSTNKIQCPLAPDEYLTKMSGYFGMYKYWKVVKSLTFHTNLRPLGISCGPKEGEYFDTSERGKILGFFGKASDHLIDSIGVYMKLGVSCNGYGG